MWKNIVEPCRPQIIIWRMRIDCWIPRDTNTHWEYVIRIAFPLQQWFTNEPQCWVIRTLLVLFITEKGGVCCAVRSELLNVIQVVLESVPTIPTTSATCIHLFLRKFTKPRKATINFIMAVRSPLRPQEITLPSLDGFVWNCMVRFPL